MKRHGFFPFLFASLFCLTQIACNNDGPEVDDSPWLINTENILDGGPGKDGIPSVDNPEFKSIAEIADVADDELVVGIKIGTNIKAYPHTILDWHEIVNDRVGQEPVAITYCPLTGTAIGWDATVNGQATEFGVSGLLYNTNLMPYDRNSNSTWSQMRLDCVNGSLIDTKIKTVQVLETSYSTWKSLYPESQIMTRNTGINRSYGEYPYGDYKTSNSTIFPLIERDDRLPLKERVLGIQGDESKVYRFDSFKTNGVVTVVNDVLAGSPMVVFGSEEEQFMVAFENDLNGVAQTFTPIARSGAIIAADEKGNFYDIFGTVLEGPDSGASLKSIDQYIGYWLAWGSFHPGIAIYE